MIKVTLRGIVSHLLRLALTIVAVVLSVAFMSGTQFLTATIQSSFDKVFDDVYKNIDTVVRSNVKVETGFGAQRALIEESVVPTVQKVQGVQAVEGQVQGILTILDKNGEPLGNGNAGPPTFGLNWLTEPSLNGWHVNAGAPPAGPDDVVLDQKTADTAGYKVGDIVQIQFNKGTKPLHLTGTASFGATANYAGSAAALFSTATAQQYLAEPGKFTWINVSGQDGVSQDELRGRVAAVIPKQAEAITGQAFTAESQDAFRKFFGFLGTILLVFAGVAIFVGSFIIYNTFAIIVAQSTRQLALLRAMGASRSQIILSVVVEAGLVGAVASVLGLIGGALLATFLTSVLAAAGLGPDAGGLTYPPVAFISSFTVGVVVTVVAGLLPAWKASRVPPVAAMRDIAIDPSARSTVRVVLGSLMSLLGAVLLYLSLFRQSSSSLPELGASIVLIILGITVLGPVWSRPLSAVLGAPLRKVTGRLARANAMRNPKRTSITAAALMIGVGLIVLFTILANSIKVSVNAAIDASFTGDFVIDSGSFGQTGFDPSLATDVGNVNGVQSATGIRLGFAQLSNSPTSVVGVDPAGLQSVVKVDVLGGNLDDIGADGIAVSKDQADKDHLQIGQKVPIKFLQGGFQYVPVKAIYTIEAQQQNGLLMTYEGFAKRFPPSLNVDNIIYVKLAPGADSAAVKSELKTMVKERFPSAKVQDLTEFKESQTGFVNILLFIILVLLVLAVVIAVLGIFNTLLLSIYERTREIGLLRAVGGLRTQVRSSIRWEAVIFSVQGTLIGIAIGFGFAWALVRALSREAPIELAVPVGQLIGLVLLAMIAGVVAAIIPSFTASRLDILKAIATE